MTQLVASIDNGVGVVRLARPEKRNSLTHEMADQFLAAVELFKASGVTVVIIEAEPPMFCAGNDLVEARAGSEPTATTRILTAIMTEPLFFIAVVAGATLGAGIALAALCPVVVVGSDAWFSLPELRFGVFPSGVTMYLEWLIGPRLCMTLGLTGDRLEPQNAVAAGLATEVVQAGTERDAALAWATRLVPQEQLVTAARQSWQSRFSSAEFGSRFEVLRSILDSQQLA